MTSPPAYLVPYLLRARRGENRTLTYDGEVELATTMAALAEMRGIVARTQVPVALGGFADLVLGHRACPLLVLELKLELTRRSQFRKAAEQVLSYDRHIGSVHCGIAAPVVNADLIEEFQRTYPTVSVFDLPAYVDTIDGWADHSLVAERAAALLSTAADLMGHLPRTDKNVESWVSVKALRSLMEAAA